MMEEETLIALVPYLILGCYVLWGRRFAKRQKLAHLAIAATYFILIGWLWRYNGKEGRTLAYWFYFALLPVLHLGWLILYDAYSWFSRARKP